MLVHYVPRLDIAAALEPDASLWRGARAEAVPLIGTPVGLQPTEMIRVAWLNKKIGAVDRVEVSALHDGERIAFRLAWSDPTQNCELGDTTAFPDAAGVLLPVTQGAASVTMGAPGLLVNAWYWRADEDGRGRQVVAEGIGTTRPIDTDQVRGQGVWRDGGWRVVITRALKLQASEPVAQLAPGETTGFAVAVWEGSHMERAGLKAFSGDWRELRLEALPTAKR